MSKHYQELRAIIKSNAAKNYNQLENKKYHGNDHYCYGLRVPVMRQIAREWAKSHKDIPEKEFINTMKALYSADSYDEKCIAGILLGYLPELRSKISPQLLSGFLDELVGWAEIDSTCQSNFTAKELLANWDEWSHTLEKLSHSPNINKRRASIVLLNKSVEGSKDPKLAILAFKIINTLTSEKDILITKAISWSLRSLIKNHAEEVRQFLEKNQNSLPKIAIRETIAKLNTGKKYHYTKHS